MLQQTKVSFCLRLQLQPNTIAQKRNYVLFLMLEFHKAQEHLRNLVSISGFLEVKCINLVGTKWRIVTVNYTVSYAR